MSTVTFDKLQLDVNGTDTVVLAAGDADAPPLVFLHGGARSTGGDSLSRGPRRSAS